MKAITVEPGVPGSVSLDDIEEPNPSEGAVLVQTVAVGVCGTDREIIDGAYGVAPPGRRRLVLGHESLGSVLEAPPETGFRPGDLVVGIVRRPDPVPCDSCAVGEWDMCRNGQYVEHGIKELDGFARERFRADANALVKVDRSLGRVGVLLEPASIVAKAWVQIERIGSRAHWTPRRVLILGAGPVGLLAALMGVQRRLEVHVLDRVKAGLKPSLVASLGATYHSDGLSGACTDVDIVIECTGASSLLLDAIHCVAADGIVCLAGVAAAHKPVSVDAAALNNELVLENNVVFGTVNANLSHYAQAAAALARADRMWLGRLITREVPLDSWQTAYEPVTDDVKTVLAFTAHREA